MPKGNANGQMHGFQLWANLPSSLKMTAPRYQDVQGKDIPEIIDDDGTRVKVIVGNFWGKSGPVDGIAADPQYLDIYVPAGVKKTFKVIHTARHSLISLKVQVPLPIPAHPKVCCWKKKSWAKK